MIIALSISTFLRLEHDDSLEMTEFQRLGLLPEILQGLSAKGFVKPTPVQRTVIPRIMNKENMVMAASTGSGKTFAFTLPVIQSLINQESAGYSRTVKRPRALILVPTRELARQILSTIKDISHFAKVSSACVLGGEPYANQKKSLDRMVDIVVASPGRLMQHKDQVQNIRSCTIFICLMTLSKIGMNYRMILHLLQLYTGKCIFRSRYPCHNR